MLGRIWKSLSLSPAGPAEQALSDVATPVLDPLLPQAGSQSLASISLPSLSRVEFGGGS